MSTPVDRVLETVRRSFSSLAPSVTVDEDGKPVLTFGVSKHAKLGPALDEVLETPAKIAAEGNQNMDRSRPLYRAGAHCPLGLIAEEQWQPFILKQFTDPGKVVSKHRIHGVYDLTQGHPFYTQHLLHVLWAFCEPKAEVMDKTIQKAVQVLLDREDYAYTMLREPLTVPQKRFLKGLAGESTGVKVFAGEFVRHYGLGSASNVQRVVGVLLEKDIIDRSNGSFLIMDRFFRLWIQSVQMP